MQPAMHQGQEQLASVGQSGQDMEPPGARSIDADATAANVSVAPPLLARLAMQGGHWSSPLAQERTVALDKPELYIGLLEANDVVVHDPRVSRLHAVIRWTPSGYEIEDLGSTHGTYLDGQLVTGRTPLHPGMSLRIGGTELRFEQGRSEAPNEDDLQPTDPFSPSTIQCERGEASPVLQADSAIHPATRQSSAFHVWLQRTAAKRYWRIFLFGALAFIAADMLLRLSLNLHAVPLVILLASALVPVTFVLYCWETGVFADMPASVVGLTYIGGAVFGLLVAGLLEDVLLVSVSFLGVISVAIIEEIAKAGVVIAFLRDKRLRSELDGLVLGAAAGMGFATLETAGYGFNAFLTDYTASIIHSGSAATAPVINQAMAAGITTMTTVLVLRMALSLFGHSAWTAIVCAAVWRERRPSVLRITGGVLLAFGLIVALHALWDSAAVHPPLTLVLLPLCAASSLWLLRFFIREAVARAKLGSLAPAPVPLPAALLYYLRHPMSHPLVRAPEPAQSVAASSKG